MRGRFHLRLVSVFAVTVLCAMELASYFPAVAFENVDDYSLTHEVTNSWDGGYQADLTLNNLSDKDMTDWQISFTIPAEITDSWGGTFVLSDSVEYEAENDESSGNPADSENPDGTENSDDAQAGGSVSNMYVVTAGDYNSTIPAGGSITVGYVANGDSGDITDIEVDYTLATDTSNEHIQTEPSGNIYVGSCYTVEVQIPQSWEHAYNAKLIITNTSDETLHNWGFLLKTDDDISGLYNAIELYNHDGMRLFKNAGYNQDIPAGGTVEVGYTAYYGDSFDVPDEFALTSFERNVEMPGYRVETFVTDEWDDGALAEVVIENISDKAIEDWKLEFDSDMNISRVWDGVMVSHDGNHYVVRNADYSQNIASGDTWTIGMEINGSISDIGNFVMTEITVADDTQSRDETTVSENTVSENTVSENIVEPEIYDGKYVIIDTTEYGEATGLPLVDEYIEQIGGFLVDSENVFSVSYEVYDSFGERVKNGVLDINDDKWQASGIGLGIGCNKIVFKIILKNGTEIEESDELINLSLDNLLNADIDLDDTDGDHILNYFEKYYNTNKTLADTDEDGLLDGEEVYYADSDPNVYDSLSKGTADGKIDLDGDGLSNKEEVQIGASPLNADSDDDGLSDGFEAHTSYTNPTEYDTDGDGYSDGEELNLGLDPLSSDSDNNGIPDGSEIIKQHVTQNYDDQVIKEATVDISCAGSIKEKVFVSSKYDPDSVACDVIGLIGMPVNVNCHTDFETAEITFRYDETMLGDTKETDLCLMWYDEDNCEFVLLEDSVVDVTNNTVKYTTTHFSTYMLVDREKWKTRYPIDYTVSDYSINENYDFIVFIDYTVSPQDLLREQAIAANIVDKMEEGDRLLFLYLKSNSVYQKQINGGLNWSTTKQQALSNIDPNDAWSIWGSGVSLSPTGLYNGCAEQSLKAVTYIGNTVNKQIIYLIYPGDRYDTRFSENYSLMNDNAQIAKANGCVFNAVSLTDNVSATLTQYTLMMNGVQYTGTDEQIDSAIFADLSSRLSIGDTFIDTTDSDGDGLYDVYETMGMVGTNGCVYYSDPNIVDSDGDGFADGEEVGDMDPETGYFGVVSDPMNADSIKRGGDYYDPVYIVAWSYGRDEVKKFEKKYQHSANIAEPDDDNSDWNDDMWNLFEKENSFSRAAQTKGRELEDKGIECDNIVIQRVDDAESFKSIWNDEWTKYMNIQELHMYSHGKNGSPEVYCGTDGLVGEISIYSKLNWNEYSKVYFYGCRTALGGGLQGFATNQGVITYGNLYGTCFSTDPDEKKAIDVFGLSEDVYLNCYGIPWVDVYTGLDVDSNKGADATIFTKYWFGDSRMLMKVFVP